MTEETESRHIYDRILRVYLSHRFGSDQARVARIVRAYNSWCMTHETGIHVVSADQEKVLIPVWLLDRLAAGVKIAPITDALPPWAADQGPDEMDRPRPRTAEFSEEFEKWIGVMNRENEILLTLARRYQLIDLGEGAS